MPSVDLPYGAEVEESLIIGGGWPDGGSFHMIEFTQVRGQRHGTAFTYSLEMPPLSFNKTG